MDLLRKTLAGGLALLLSASCSHIARAGVGISPEGWHEAVLSVANLDRWESFWTATNGWEVIARSAPGPETYGGYAASEVLLRNKGTDSGFIRLISFDSEDSEPIRPNAQSWDVGGWFDINVRTADLDKKALQLERLGWSAYSNPVQFSFGPFVVKEWLARGPDGIVVAFIERVAPALTGWPHMKDVSRTFNATHIVDDMDTSLSFYTETLGFRLYLEHEGASKQPGPNVLGLPHNLTTDIPRRVMIVHPEGKNAGSIELLQFVGADGADYRARARAPNRGILSLRFPAHDLDELKYRLAAQGVEVVGPTTVLIEPYGEVKRLICYGPSGEMLEFIESPFGRQ